MRTTLLMSIFFILLCSNTLAQKGEKSISAGLLTSFPMSYGGHTPYVKKGWGGEVNGVYQFTNRSGVQLQAGITGFRNKYFPEYWTVFSLKAGYHYGFGTSGIYLNALAGPEFDFKIGDPLMTYTLGGGKRFYFKNAHFLDAGVDYINGSTEPRVNVKLAYGLQWGGGAKTTQPL